MDSFTALLSNGDLICVIADILSWNPEYHIADDKPVSTQEIIDTIE